VIPLVGQTVAYVSSAGSREIISFALDVEARTLTPSSTTAVPGEGPSPTNMPLTLGPRASRLYAAVRSAPFPLTSYSIDGARGALAPLATARLPDAMTDVATDRTGRWLFAASYTGAKLSVSSIDEEGRVQDPAVQVIYTLLKAHCILADPRFCPSDGSSNVHSHGSVAAAASPRTTKTGHVSPSPTSILR
jgi:6-phosphogluconolactonase